MLNLEVKFYRMNQLSLNTQSDRVEVIDGPSICAHSRFVNKSIFCFNPISLCFFNHNSFEIRHNQKKHY